MKVFVFGCNELYIGEVDDDPFVDLLSSTEQISSVDPLSLVVLFPFVGPFAFTNLDPTPGDILSKTDPFMWLDPVPGDILVDNELLFILLDPAPGDILADADPFIRVDPARGDKLVDMLLDPPRDDILADTIPFLWLDTSTGDIFADADPFIWVEPSVNDTFEDEDVCVVDIPLGAATDDNPLAYVTPSVGEMTVDMVE